MACLNSTYSERLAHPLHYLLDGHYTITFCKQHALKTSHCFFMQWCITNKHKYANLFLLFHEQNWTKINLLADFGFHLCGLYF